ncbi:hypothetical protein I601_1374 [Nocardioides dokdonensis FR1436]|uniref:DUF732 domain-containing protein n=1 Tax=Nocardioides dokdonensis FR1436 TaxID=1300347 RepID=A0A1A9GJM7_9ACTN|nr:hypothetical protein [Nocardioides dokdonensis]ANH37813.1 hypothetical protein I601_1374 [Nocardioides dokdonensis FR1436]
MKHALAPLAVLVALTAAACGSDDETSDASSDPTTASSSSSSAGDPGTDNAFCTALVGNGALEDGSDVETLMAGLEASGIPDDAPQEASKGFDVYLDILGDIDTDASAEELAAMEDFDLSKSEQQQVNALVQYAGATCAPPAEGESGSESAPADGGQDQSEESDEK